MADAQVRASSSALSNGRIIIRVMGDEPRGRRWESVAALAVLVAVTVTAGTLIAILQRPPTTHVPTRPTPAPTPFPFPTVAPTPIPNGPVLGFGFSVADDPAIDRVVVYGGVDSYNTTWLWDGRGWTLARPRSIPPGRFGAAMAYDPTSRLLMLFGGRLAPGQVVNDTWGWDGTTWRRLDDGVNGPPPGEFAQMAWDDSRAELVLVTGAHTTAGGETWIWAGSHWTREGRGNLSIAPIAGAMAYDPVLGALLLVSPVPPDAAHTATLGLHG